MKKILFSVLALCCSAWLLAQEGGADRQIDVDINTDGGGGGWYTSPWLWVVGGAVFVLLLVALTRGSGRRGD